MCILPTLLPIDYDTARKVEKLIGKNLLDYPEFKPFVETVVKERLKDLSGYCERTGEDYDEKFRSLCKIWYWANGYATFVIPHRLTRNDVEDNTDAYKLWCECVNTYLENNI